MSLEELFHGGGDAEDAGGSPGRHWLCAHGWVSTCPVGAASLSHLWVAFSISQTSRVLQAVDNASAPGFAVVIQTLVVTPPTGRWAECG